MSGRPVLVHLDIGRLVAAAGGDPWAIEEQLHAGDPAAIEGLAEAFHTAGGHVKAADDEFARAREQFTTAYSRDHGSQHPINDSAEVHKMTAALAAHPEALATIAVSLEQIAAGLAEAQQAASAEIDELNTALLSIDAELSEAAVPLLILNLLKEADEQTKMSVGILEKIQGTYALQLHTEQTTMQASGYGGEAIDAADGVDQHGLPSGTEPGGPYAAGTLAGLQRAMDQAVLDEMAKARQIQKEIDDTAALVYTKGPGSPEAQDALARLPGLKQKLVDELNTLGSLPDYSGLDPNAVSSTADGNFLLGYKVDGIGVQAMGKLTNGTGEVFDQAKQAYFTFKDGKLVGVRQLDPGQVTPDDELLFNAVTLAVGAPELAVGVKAGGELAFQGLKSLLGGEGVAALRSSGESLLTKSLAAAQTRAEAAGYRFSDDWAPRSLPATDGLPPPAVTAGHPPPPAVVGEHPHPVAVGAEHSVPAVAADPSAYAPHAPAAAADLNAAFAAGHPTTSLAQQVAELSTHHMPSPVGDLVKADRVVLGRWDGMDGGYIGEARHNGGIYFDTGDETWSALTQGLSKDDADGLAWRVNESFLRRQLANGIPRVDYTLPDGFTSVDQVAARFERSFSAREINFLNDHAAEFGYSRVDNSWIFVGGNGP